MVKWYFDLTGEKQDIWSWCMVDDANVVQKRSDRTFPYYLDCVADAKKHGFTGTPSFHPTAQSTIS